MAVDNDRKGAIKKLKLLTYGAKSKVTVEAFREKLDETYKSVFNPNGVECKEYKYGNVPCDILSPEIYSSNRIMLYIHGGSYVGGSRAAYRSLCSSLATKCFCRCVVPEYRLAPTYPYPAANEDIQSVFRALFTEEQVNQIVDTDKGEKPHLPEIIIAADSSAAAIAVSLILNLRDKYRNCIKHLILFSPWLDVSPSSPLISQKKQKDEVMSGEILKKSSLVYTYESNLTNPFVSPLFAEEEALKKFPPVYIQMGEKEILLNDAKAFKDKLINAGNECVLDVWDDMMFMFQMADEYLKESHLAIDQIGKVITEQLTGERTTKVTNTPKLENSLRAEA